MSKLGIVGATALSLALAVTTPALAVGLYGGVSGGAVHVANNGLRSARASIGSGVSSADAAYCRSLGAYYDSTSGKYMDGTGLWRPCP